MERKVSVAELPIHASPVEMHRRQMLRQVWLPLIISIIIVLAVMIIATVGTIQGSTQINRWGNISAILIILPILLAGLIFLALIGAGIYGLRKALQVMPEFFTNLQIRAAIIALGIRRAADSSTKPIFAVNNFTVSVKTVWNRVFRSNASRRP